MTAELATVYQRVSSIAGGSPLVQPVGQHHHALVRAVGMIGAHDGFQVNQKIAGIGGETVGEALRRLALLSGFRYRQVNVDGNWWKEEGPSLLVTHGPDNTPLAVIRDRNACFVQDPQSGVLTPMTRTIAEQVADVGFQIYPGFHGPLTARTFVDFAMRHAKGELLALVGAAGLATIIALIVPIATSVVVSKAIPDGRTPLMIEMAALVAAGACGILALGAVRSLLTIRLESLVNMRLQAAIWDRVLRLPSTFFRQYSSGDLVRRVLAIDEARQLLTGQVLGGVLSGLFSVVSFTLMLFYDRRLAIFGVGYAAVVAIILCVLAWMQIKHVKAYRLAQGEVTSSVFGLLAGINKLRLAAAEERGLLQWSTPFSHQQRAVWQYTRLQTLQNTFIGIIGPLGIAGAIVVAGMRAEAVSLGAFTAFNAAFGQFIAAIGTFGTSLNALVSIAPLIDRAAPVLRAKPEVEEAAADPGQLAGAFAFRNVSFRYSSDGPLVVDNVSFSVEPGEFVALVGGSGAGKSTVLRLLLGFERPTSGTVYYDNHDLARLDSRLVRHQVGTVLQSASLLPGSLYHNIAGSRVLTDEEVMEAARKAAIGDEISLLPMGLDTFISEDAGTISGGQKQRIVIARALAGNPKIVLLDEATSALDNYTQSVVQKSIGSLNVSRLVIAHRLSTIRYADRILVLDRGKIAESGNYDELMAREGAFYNLAKRQLA